MSIAPAVTTTDFDKEVLQSGLPVLVDFTASWCPPCRTIAPHIDALAGEMDGRAKVLKLDVDAEPEVEARYGVRSIPTLIIFKNGEVVDRIVGAYPRAEIAARLQTHV